MFDDTRGGGGDGGGMWWGGRFRHQHYILDGHTVVPCDLMTWARWFAKADRVVTRTRVRGVTVSTVFIGLDSEIAGPPMVFETGVFIGRDMVTASKTSVWLAATVNHDMVCADVWTARSGRALAHMLYAERAELRENYGYRVEGLHYGQWPY